MMILAISAGSIYSAEQAQIARPPLVGAQSSRLGKPAMVSVEKVQL